MELGHNTDQEPGGGGPGLWAWKWRGWCGLLTAVGRLLVRLVLAVGDTVAREAEVDALAIGTLELILGSARGIHRWGGRWGELHESGPLPECPYPSPLWTGVTVSASLAKELQGLGWRVWEMILCGLTSQQLLAQPLCPPSPRQVRSS